MNLEEIRNRLDREWESKALKVDWSKMEDILLAILRHVNRATIAPGEAFRLIDVAIGAFTKRGESLDSAWTFNRMEGTNE